MTMQQIYHNLISPLFQLHPEDFRKKKNLVEDIHQVLKSIGTFFEKKRSLEASIRGSFVTGNGKKDFFSNSLDNTMSSVSEN
jgi:F0F1-type ATP synthase delta subunit